MKYNNHLMTDKEKEERQKLGNAILSDKVINYANDPLVIKKAKQSREFVTLHGFPKQLVDKK